MFADINVIIIIFLYVNLFFGNDSEPLRGNGGSTTNN